MRKQLSMKNFITGIIPYFVLAILGFVRVDFFVDNLGDEIYAINQLFFQIFAYISLVEAGIGPLITQQYYKFFADQDHKSISGLYTTSKKMLQKISIAILIIGFIVSLFLKFLTNNNLALGYMQIVFMIFLFRSILEYLMLSPRLVLQADQRIYKINVLLNAYKVIEIIVEITLLQCGIDYLVILLSSIVVRFLSYYYTNRKIFKEYPWLTVVNKNEVVKLKNSTSVLWHKLADAIYNNTDILLISAKLEPISVVIYSAYKYIVKFIVDGVYILSNALTASFGNVVYKSKKADKHLIFEEMNMAFLAAASFFTITVYVLSHTFVSLWLGPNKLMDNLAFIFMIIVLFNDIARRPFLICRDANGLFKETQLITIVESFLNLILSIVLVFKYGVVGVLFATAFSTLATSFWFYPRYIYKQAFYMDSKQYFLKYFTCVIITIIGCFVGRHLFEILPSSGYVSWIFSAVVICLLAIVLIAITFIICFKDFRRLLYKAKLLLEEMKIMERLKNMKKMMIDKEVLIKLLMFFLMLQPVLDIYILFEPTVVSFFHFSPTTIIRILFVGLLLLMLGFTLKYSKKYFLMLGYIFLVVLYAIFHHLNAMQFQSNVPGNFGYSFTSEIFYIIRMLLPLIMIIISYHVKFSEKRMQTVIQTLILLISGSIVITNLFSISLASYTKTSIAANIFTWFTDQYEKYNYLQLASRGFFVSANRISALELLLTPIWLFFFIKKPTKKNIVITIIHIIAMLMLGTKVATLGIILLLILSFLIYCYCCFIQKEFEFSKKILYSFIMFVIIWSSIFPLSPAMNRNNIDNNREQNSETMVTCKKMKQIPLGQIKYEDPLIEYETDDLTKCSLNKDLEKQKLELVERNLAFLSKEEEKVEYLKSFIEVEYENFNIKTEFLFESYPYQYNPYFWYDIMKEPLMVRTNFRILEERMLSNIKKQNNNYYDNYFGITFTRMSNIFDLERDFISHYYTLGWCGLILLLFPYLIIVVFGIILMLFQFKEKINFYNIMLLFSIGITLFAAYYSGNIMDGLIVTLILGFIIGQFVQCVYRRNKTMNEKKKISIIMPTYNDAKSICETLDSVIEQTYQNWELIIVDDGSKDETRSVIKSYKKAHKNDNRIQYVYQKNTDQLKAIIHGMDYISGDYIYILHSDDLLATKMVFERAVQYLEKYTEVDAIIGDLIVIDENSKITGRQEVLSYLKKEKTPAIQLLWLGRNLYVDFAFHRKKFFFENVKENYLTWNTPFWLNTSDSLSMLNVKKVDFEFIKYRVHSGNYINNDIGKLNVINGELRTVTRLMKYYDIPNYKKQFYIFRIFNRLNFLQIYKPLYKKREFTNKAEVLDFIIRKRFSNGYNDNCFLKSLVSFYENFHSRKIYFKDIYNNEIIYKGNEMRQFNKELIDNKLPNLYLSIFKEMQVGFDEIIVKTEEEKEKAINLTKFLCIYPFVKVTKK